MTATESTAEKQIVEEIAQIQSKISSLESYLLNEMRSQQPLDAPITGDATPEEIIQKAKKLAQQQQEAISRSAEEKVVENTLKLLRQELAQKEDALQILKRSTEFERLQHKAREFNALIDEAVARLDEMKEIGREIAFREYTPLTISAEPREMPYCSIHPSTIRVRRRVDVKRES